MVAATTSRRVGRRAPALVVACALAACTAADAPSRPSTQVRGSASRPSTQARGSASLPLAPEPVAPTAEDAGARAPAPPPPGPAEVERLDVPDDAAAWLVRDAANEPPRTVFLPGLCSNAYAYLLTFPEAARAQGGVVALDGDAPCRGAPGFHSFSWDAARLHRRIESALGAAGRSAAPREGLTLVGYSQGASLGEQLVQQWPELYRRLVLIGSPKDPMLQRIERAQAVVTMSCSLDVPGRMKAAARRIQAAGIPSTYLELPGCTHGNITDGERVMGEAFRWLAAR